MPFTVSHAAAVLPFRRTRLPWPALVIGSFGPDFEYFLRASGSSRAWHYYPEVFTRCFPFTVIIYFVFLGFVRGPVIDLLPVGFQRRIPRKRAVLPEDLGEVGLLLLALGLGIATHVLWDSFTHPQSWFWRNIPFLREVIHFPSLPGVYGYEIAQGGSSVLGLVLLGVATMWWYRRTPPGHTSQGRYSAARKVFVVGAMIVLSLGGAAWRAYSVVGRPQSPGEFASFQLLFVISSLAIFLWELVLYGMAMTAAGRRD
jgi:hypothetical protein